MSQCAAMNIINNGFKLETYCFTNVLNEYTVLTALNDCGIKF
jgi:hypothetical protein